jgi:coenzyme F420-0:L-glutamate ligase/coenzyme F420-1:gamma-L-glutamate ligase
LNGGLPSFSAHALPGLPLIAPGDDLTALILVAAEQAGLTLRDGDVLVVTSKVVSKAEGCIVDLRTVEPSERAHQLAAETDKDPRVVELVLRESRMISRQRRGVLVVEHRLGFVSANAGIDQSNLDADDEHVLLLPVDPDASARAIRVGIQEALGVNVGVVISDSHGRPFRLGNVGVAIGVAGVPPLRDLRGDRDLYGRELRISVQGFADQVASAANLLSGEGAEGLPVVLLRGLRFEWSDGQAADAYRPADEDLYR